MLVKIFSKIKSLTQMDFYKEQGSSAACKAIFFWKEMAIDFEPT